MKCILLAGGFATRMYPLTKGFPKPLLKIAGTPIISVLANDLLKISEINEIIVVTNKLFEHYFIKWKNSINSSKIKLYTVNITEPTPSYGAVNCIVEVYKSLGIKEDTLILAADNLLTFSIKQFVEYYSTIKESCVMCYEENDKNKQRLTGVITLDKNNKIKKMVEKPTKYISNIAVPPFYIYKSELANQIISSINIVRDTSSPGFLLEALCKTNSIYAFEMPSSRIDLGTTENYYKYKEQGIAFNE